MNPPPKERSCDGKRRYSKRVAKRVESGHKGIVAYRCLYCPWWHVGHPARWWQRRKGER